MQYADPGGGVPEGTCLCKLYRYVPSKVSLVFELSGYERRSWILASSRKLGMALKRLMNIYICAFSPLIETARKKGSKNVVSLIQLNAIYRLSYTKGK